MELEYYFTNVDDGEAILILGSRYNKNLLITGNNIKEYLYKVATERRVNKVLKMIGLDEDVLSKTPEQISNLDNALIHVAYQLLIGKDLVINYLDVLLNHKEEIYLKRLLSKLVHQYKLRLLLFTNNIEFCFGLIDRIFIVNNREIVKYLNNDFYNMEIYKYVDMPDIISFVKLLQSKGKKIDNYLDMSELLKGIYRLW